MRLRSDKLFQASRAFRTTDDAYTFLTHESKTLLWQQNDIKLLMFFLFSTWLVCVQNTELLRNMLSNPQMSQTCLFLKDMCDWQPKYLASKAHQNSQTTILQWLKQQICWKYEQVGHFPTVNQGPEAVLLITINIAKIIKPNWYKISHSQTY